MIKFNIENGIKKFSSDNINYTLDLISGQMKVWGKTEDEDPQYSDVGPFIADIEITTKCSGIGPNHVLCPYCYKANTHSGDNMSLDTFKKVIEKINFNNQLTQVAFGLGSAGNENPELWDMCDYLHSLNIGPNGTVADIDEETAEKIGTHFRGVAVSFHGDWEVFYNSISRLVKAKSLPNATLQQVNVHFCIYEESLEDLKKLLFTIKSKKEPRLEGLNAVVLLALKKQGRAKNNDSFNQLTQDHMNEIIQFFMKNQINMGFDSCSCHKFCTFVDEVFDKQEEAIKALGKYHQVPEMENYLKQVRESKKKLLQQAEPCESGCMSSYINTKGMFYPCSFCEMNLWGYDVLNGDFKKFWENDINEMWRDNLLANNRRCPVYEI